MDEEPDLSDDERYFLKGFLRLSTSRSFGGGIPFSEVMKYCDEIHLFSMEDRLDLSDIISSLDGFYMELSNSKGED